MNTCLPLPGWPTELTVASEPPATALHSSLVSVPLAIALVMIPCDRSWACKGPVPPCAAW